MATLDNFSDVVLTTCFGEEDKENTQPLKSYFFISESCINRKETCKSNNFPHFRYPSNLFNWPLLSSNINY